ncbi:rCG51158 [Rattus norvegicus]|uniref:RCG51158 n=1 Tax=Rattus norvegicus TaxID=10116 RepID=A6IYL3_RAT|nr:rCG51158 [Rattus norvegicus]
MHLKKSRMLKPFHSHIGFYLHNLTSSLGLLKELADRTLYDWRSTASIRSSHLPHESVKTLSGSLVMFKDYNIRPYKKKELQPIKKELKPLDKRFLYHGPNLKTVIKMYQCLIHHVRHCLSLWRTRQITYFGELEEWMDRKKIL